MTDSIQRVGTPEGVAFELHPAGPVPRFLALLLDVLIGLFVLLFVVAGLAALGLTGVYLILLLMFTLQVGWMIAFEQWGGGTSPGKRALGLQVVMADGRPVTLAASVIRNLLRFPDQLAVVGWLVPLFTPGFRRMGDLAAGTLVVYRADLWVRLEGAGLDGVTPLAPQRPLGPDAAWAAVEYGRRWAEFGPGLRHELAVGAADLYRRDLEGRTPEDALRSVAAWYGGRR